MRELASLRARRRLVRDVRARRHAARDRRQAVARGAHRGGNPEVRDRLIKLGAVPVADSPADFKKFIQAELKAYAGAGQARRHPARIIRGRKRGQSNFPVTPTRVSSYRKIALPLYRPKSCADLPGWRLRRPIEKSYIFWSKAFGAPAHHVAMLHARKICTATFLHARRHAAIGLEHIGGRHMILVAQMMHTGWRTPSSSPMKSSICVPWQEMPAL